MTTYEADQEEEEATVVHSRDPMMPAPSPGSKFNRQGGSKFGRREQLVFIRPGKPTENGMIESFNGRLRDECLNAHVFGSIGDAQNCLKLGPTSYVV